MKKIKLKLPRGAEGYFRRFLARANISVLHDNDWECFYEFIVYCHRHHVTLDYWDLRQALIAEGFREYTAKNLSDAYKHGRGILRARRGRFWFRMGRP